VAVLADPLRLVIGDRAAKPLAAALDLHTVGDLVGYYPRRYDKRGELTDLARLREGDYVTVQAEVASVSSRRMQNRKGYIFEAVVTDGHGRLSLTFFGRGRQEFREKELAPGTRGLFSGQVSSFRGKRQLTHPDYELLGAGSSGARAADFAAELIPVYRASSQMPSWKIADSVRSRWTCWTYPRTRCRLRSGSGTTCAATRTRCAASTGPWTTPIRTGRSRG
jgi:ATP-dependent DNA helicase RecG